MDDAKTAWRDLKDSPGWALLVAHVTDEWQGPAFMRLVEQMADKPGEVEALNKLRQVIAAKHAVERLLHVPEEQLAKLTRAKEAEDAPSMGRRGAL